MNDLEKLKHFKKYNKQTDFINVRDLSLNNEQFKPLHELDYKGRKFSSVLKGYDNLIEKVTQENATLKQEIEELKELVKKIVKGLNIR